MGRRVAIVGLGLIAVGLVAAVLWRPPMVQAPGLPGDHAVAFLLGLVPALASFAGAVGAVMLAIAVLTLVTGQPPVREHPRLLLWAGLGSWFVAFVPESLLLSGGTTGPVWPLLTVVHLSFALKLTGAALVALWLAGLLTSRGPAGAPSLSAAAGFPRTRAGGRGHDEDESADV